MEQETINLSSEKKCKKGNVCGTPRAVYGLGFVGAAVYFIQNADTFWLGALGILKALVWPAILIYKLFSNF